MLWKSAEYPNRTRLAADGFRLPRNRAGAQQVQSHDEWEWLHLRNDIHRMLLDLVEPKKARFYPAQAPALLRFGAIRLPLRRNSA